MRTRNLTLAMLVLTGLTAASCAGSRDLQLTSSGAIPAAASTLKVATTDNGNTSFDLAVEHLAHPQKVDSAANVYVVWIRGLESNARVQNMGALTVNDDLNGSFAGVTPLKEFEIFVTAEPTQSNTTPTGKALLYTSVAPKP